jgi:uncharacterized protein (DUF1501 family)
MLPSTESQHPQMSRRTAIQAGALGLLGLGMNHVSALRAADLVSARPGAGRAKAVIFVFLSGGLTQHDTFDPKPDAPSELGMDDEGHPEHLGLRAVRHEDESGC